MYRVTIECVPYESERDKYPIKTIRIMEKDYGHFGYGTYSVEETCWWANPDDEEPLEIKHDGEIKHDRRDGHLVLVRKALEHIEQNSPDNT